LSRSPLDAASIVSRLDEYLEVEFTFIRTEGLTAVLAAMPRERQEFILEWTRRAAATNTELAFQFANRAKEALHEVGPDVVSAWCLHAMDCYDNAGLQSAMSIIRNLAGFLAVGHQRAAGSVFEEAVPILIPFVQGLEGRRLKIEPGDFAWTDGETIYLPAIVARLDNQADNFQLFKSIVTHLWAQTRYGTLNVNLPDFFGRFSAPERARAVFEALETMRLDGRIAAESRASIGACVASALNSAMRPQAAIGKPRRMRFPGPQPGSRTVCGGWKECMRRIPRHNAATRAS